MNRRFGARAVLAMFLATLVVAACNGSSDGSAAPKCCRSSARNLCECHRGTFSHSCESRGEVETDSCSKSETGGSCCANPFLGTCDCSATRICGDAELEVLKCEPYPEVDAGAIEAGDICPSSERGVPCTDATQCSCNETCVQVCDTCKLTCGIFGCENDNWCRMMSSGYYTRCKTYDLNSRCEP